MKANALVRSARRRARLSQRGLAAAAGVPQSTVGRIEAGSIDPRLSTLTRLLDACGVELEGQPRLGDGVDRSQIRELLRLTPRQRIESATIAAQQLARIRRAKNK